MKPEERDAAYLWDMLKAARDARDLLLASPSSPLLAAAQALA